MSKKQPEQLEVQGVRHNGRPLPRPEKVVAAKLDKHAQAKALKQRQETQDHE